MISFEHINFFSIGFCNACWQGRLLRNNRDTKNSVMSMAKDVTTVLNGTVNDIIREEIANGKKVKRLRGPEA